MAETMDILRRVYETLNENRIKDTLKQVAKEKAIASTAQVSNRREKPKG
jgi:hypothetical protein